MIEYRGALLALLLALVVVGLTMAALHENHYKQRRYRILEARLGAVEAILTEDRRT